ncbi:MAG TPA: META domain-containing protein [Flavobacterium sp.]|nr:META domain-containing protein [Flavobacterium sp.]
MRSFLYLSLAMLIVCCQKTVKDPPPAPTEITSDTVVVAEPDHARNSLEYIGSYKGKLNCDNCPTGETMLELSEEFNYILTVTDPKQKKREHKGTFAWNKAGDAIVLDNLQGLPNVFKVRDGKLSLADPEGEPQSDAVLSKIPEAEAAKTDSQQTKFDITSVTWILAEDKPVGLKPARTKAKFLQFKNDGSFGASAGCNSIGGKYKISGSKISFSNVLSTRMACDNMTSEQLVLKAFEEADNFVANKKLLQLRKGNQILATFDAQQIP